MNLRGRVWKGKGRGRRGSGSPARKTDGPVYRVMRVEGSRSFLSYATLDVVTREGSTLDVEGLEGLRCLLESTLVPLFLTFTVHVL